MIYSEPVVIDGKTAIAIQVKLPQTTLLIITTDKGYMMCGALDVKLLNERLNDRRIIAARALGVKSISELLDAPLESVTDQAQAMGIVPGMIGREAILRMM